VIDRSDQELIVEARRGGAAALAEMLRRHQGAVRGFLRRTCGDPALADDLAQETFLTAFARLDRFRGDSSLRAWLCGIAYLKAREDRRGAGRRMVREARAADVGPAPDPRGQAERKLDVEAAFASLSMEHKAVAALCLASDWSHSEAAAALDLPLGTLKSRLAAARAILVKALEAYR
jgi:RNA polymerase sigma factor (sigma-70 family)